MGGIAWDGPLPKPPPPPPSPHPPPPSPPPLKPWPGDVVAMACTAALEQQWTFGPSGSTRIVWKGSKPAGSKCLAFAPHRAAFNGHGQALMITACSAAISQQWTLHNDSVLRNSQAVKCVDYRGQCQCAKPTVSSGAQHGLELWGCTDTRALARWPWSMTSTGQLKVGFNNTLCATVVS
eukprot:COSAG01_NODE_8215_length_2871_cov_11.806638_2_plen_179_part_00